MSQNSWIKWQSEEEMSFFQAQEMLQPSVAQGQIAHPHCFFQDCFEFWVPKRGFPYGNSVKSKEKTSQEFYEMIWFE